MTSSLQSQTQRRRRGSAIPLKKWKRQRSCWNGFVLLSGQRRIQKVTAACAQAGQTRRGAPAGKRDARAVQTSKFVTRETRCPLTLYNAPRRSITQKSAKRSGAYWPARPRAFPAGVPAPRTDGSRKDTFSLQGYHEWPAVATRHEKFKIIPVGEIHRGNA